MIGIINWGWKGLKACSWDSSSESECKQTLRRNEGEMWSRRFYAMSMLRAVERVRRELLPGTWELWRIFGWWKGLRSRSHDTKTPSSCPDWDSISMFWSQSEFLSSGEGGKGLESRADELWQVKEMVYWFLHRLIEKMEPRNQVVIHIFSRTQNV